MMDGLGNGIFDKNSFRSVMVGNMAAESVLAVFLAFTYTSLITLPFAD
jgi:hypothetical protein